MDNIKNIFNNLNTTTIETSTPTSTEQSTDCLSSVPHAVIDYNKT